MEDIKNVSSQGNNSVTRRIQSVVENLIFEDPDLKCEFETKGLNRISNGLPLSTSQAISEISGDRLRRSILLDGEEAYIANRVDLRAGRIDDLEVRDLNETDIPDFDQKHESR